MSFFWLKMQQPLSASLKKSQQTWVRLNFDFTEMFNYYINIQINFLVPPFLGSEDKIMALASSSVKTKAS